jgi:hypothetical protein
VRLLFGPVRSYMKMYILAAASVLRRSIKRLAIITHGRFCCFTRALIAAGFEARRKTTTRRIVSGISTRVHAIKGGTDAFYTAFRTLSALRDAE